MKIIKDIDDSGLHQIYMSSQFQSTKGTPPHHPNIFFHQYLSTFLVMEVNATLHQRTKEGEEISLPL